jgi:hypothetical protein
MTIEDTNARLGDDEAVSPRVRVTLSTGLRALFWLIFGGALIAMMFAHSAPSPLGAGLALVGAVAVGSSLAWAIRGQPVFGRRGPIVWGFVAALFAYVGLAGGYFWVVNRFLGAPVERTVTITGWTRHSRHNCNHFDFAGDSLALKPSTCAASAYRDEAIPGRQLVLIGRATPLGMAVESWRLGPRP